MTLMSRFFVGHRSTVVVVGMCESDEDVKEEEGSPQTRGCGDDGQAFGGFQNAREEFDDADDDKTEERTRKNLPVSS